MDTFVCDWCNRRFIREQSLTNHRITAHSRRVRKMLCPLWPDCRRIKNANGQYANAANLKVHFDKHHSQEVLDWDEIRTIIVASTYSILLFRNFFQNRVYLRSAFCSGTKWWISWHRGWGGGKHKWCRRWKCRKWRK